MQQNEVFMKNKKAALLMTLIRALIAAFAVSLIIIGANKGGYKDVSGKANRICYECIGIG